MKKLILIIAIVFSGMLMQAQKNYTANGVYEWDQNTDNAFISKWLDKPYELSNKIKFQLYPDEIVVISGQKKYNLIIDKVLEESGYMSKTITVKIKRVETPTGENRSMYFSRVFKVTVEYTTSGNVEWIEVFRNRGGGYTSGAYGRYRFVSDATSFEQRESLDNKPNW